MSKCTLDGCDKGNKEYSSSHDAYYCKKCNKWLEEACKDENCQYCNTRPSKPSEVKS